MIRYGPFTKTISVINPYATPASKYRQAYLYKNWYKQKPVTDAPNAFRMERTWITKESLTSYSDAPNHGVHYYNVNPSASVLPGQWGGAESSRALARCYAKFKDAVYENTASLGVNLVERQQTVDMIATNAGRLRRAWNALRKGKLGDFRRILGMPQKGTPWSKPNEAGKLWLEYHFGWEPLVKDIYESCDILQQPYPTKTVAARAAARGQYYRTGVVDAWNYEVPEFYYRYLMQAKVQVTNPNLHRADQLGLVNPLTLAWEVVPFSFVVDWFIPVGDFLNQWSDFCGITFSDHFTTRSSFGRGTQYYVPRTGPIVNNWGMCFSYYVGRTLGISSPGFPYPKSFKGFSVTRGATAIALLIGALSNERKYFSQTAKRA